MKEFKFKKEEDVKKDQLYVEIEFMSGDADAHQIELFKLPFKYSEINSHIEEIQAEIKKWKLTEELLDCNSSKWIDGWGDYDKIKDQYGEEIARMIENVPGDVTCCDYRQSISEIDLIAFDEEGNKLKCTNM